MCCAELNFAKFVVEHNLPFALSVTVMFPDSKVDVEFACAITKTVALITYMLAPDVNGLVLTAHLTQPFTIRCNGRNDNLKNIAFSK